MGTGLASAPVEGFWLVAQDIAGLRNPPPRNAAYGNGKGIVGIIVRRGHGQADDQRRPGVEGFRGKNQKRVDVPHLLTDLGVAVDPDDVLPLRYPGVSRKGNRKFLGYHFSAPTASTAMASPP